MQNGPLISLGAPRGFGNRVKENRGTNANSEGNRGTNALLGNREDKNNNVGENMGSGELETATPPTPIPPERLIIFCNV